MGDLYSLSVRYLERYSGDAWESPIIAALRRNSGTAAVSGAVAASAGADAARLRPLGGSAIDLMGCSHPHLEVLGTYEEYEGLQLPSKLAQRAAEFKLYLADFAGRAGIPPAALNTLGQPIALQVIARMKMTDIRDWRDAHLAFAGLDEIAVLTAIAGQK
jgi:hypothetical protein